MAAMRGQALRAATLWAAADEFRARVATAESPTTGALRSAYEGTARAAVDATSWVAASAAGTRCHSQTHLRSPAMTMTTVKMSPAISLPAPHDMSVGPNVANAGDATRILGSVAPCRVYSRAPSLARVTPGDRAHHLRPEQCQDEVAFRSADRAPDCRGGCAIGAARLRAIWEPRACGTG
jgi:hypothetical protein